MDRPDKPSAPGPARPARPGRPRPVAGQRARARDRQPTPPPPPRGHATTGLTDAGAPEVGPAPAGDHTQRDVSAGGPAPRRLGASRWRADLPLVLAVLLVLALAATAVTLTARARAADAAEQARSSARAAAETAAVTILSYDHRRLDQDFARARELLTGAFADDYASTTEKVVRPSAEEVKAVVTAEVASSSVVRTAGADTVVVLLFVDQTTTSTRLDGPKVDLNRVRMTMTRAGSGGDREWLVSGIDAL